MPTTTTFVDFYDLLSVPETAEPDRIKTAIRDQRRLWNKRAAGTDAVQRSLAEQRVRDLGQAERVLLTVSSRQEYDSTRLQKKAQAAAEASAATASTSGVRDWLMEARDSYRLGNAHAANYAAREAIATNGANHEAWNIRANSSFLLGNYADSSFEFREAIRLQPHNDSYHFDYGEALSASGDWAGALGEYEVALQQSSGNGVYKTAIANVYLHTAKPEQALALMEEVVKAAPDVQVFKYYLALALHDVTLEKWSKLRNNAYLITSPEQIAVTRQMSNRALQLNFDDAQLRASLQENLTLADRAEAQRWTSSSRMLWYLGGVALGFIIMVSGFGSGAPGVGFVGLLVFAGAIVLFVVRHHKPQWKYNSVHPGIARRGI